MTDSAHPALTGRTAAILAHPGHELRVHHWLERTRPTVFVLTDGSGHTGVSRLDTTSHILDRAGAVAGTVYGRLTDRQLYAAMLDGDVEMFKRLATELAEALAALRVTAVASDAVEGYNPGHDVCRYVSEAAVSLLAGRYGHEVPSYDFLLVGRPDDCPPDLAERALRLELDDAALDRKVQAARSYAEIAADVEKALREHGRQAFRVECLRPMTRLDLAGDYVPFYERYGEQQVKAGHYDRVLRFHDHLLPVAAALRAHAEGAVR